MREDVSGTIAWLAERDIADESVRAVSWDLMQPQPITLGGVIDQFRWSLGTANRKRSRMGSARVRWLRLLLGSS